MVYGLPYWYLYFLREVARYCINSRDFFSAEGKPRSLVRWLNVSIHPTKVYDSMYICGLDVNGR